MNRLRHHIFISLGFVTLVLILASRVTRAGQTSGPIKVKSITLGLVSGTSPREIEAHFQNLVGYVARKLGSGPDIEGR